MSHLARNVFVQQFAAEKVCGAMAAHFEHIAALYRLAPEKIPSAA
jgi:hypothetical protein